jgi:hypothetical protein
VLEIACDVAVQASVAPWTALPTPCQDRVR